MNCESILEKLNVPYKRVSNGKELQFRCVNPKHEDRNASCFMESSSGLWHCFSCQMSGNLNSFVKLVSGETLDLKNVMTQGESILMKIRNNKKFSAENILEYERDADFRLQFQIEEDNFIPALQNELAKDYLLTKRKLTAQTVKDFDLRFAYRGRYENRVIIPYWLDGKIIGMNSRYIGECESSYRYRYMVNSKKFDDYLFNYGNVVSGDLCVLAEGPFDLMYLHQCGFKNVISTLNTRMSKGHLKKLLGFKSIIFCFDNDEETKAGDKAVEKHASEIFSINPNKPVYKVKLPNGKDPNECSLEELKKCFGKLRKLKPKKED